MINVLSTIEGNKNEVGSTLTAEVAVEGKTVKALLDTGSPVTILSVDLLFNHWAQHKKAEQTVEEWKQEVKSRLKSPSFTLRNYEGNELNILKEVTVKLERGGYSCTAVVFLQKNPPQDLLIGTDLLPSLGFQFIKKTSNLDVAVNILTYEKCNVGGNEEKSAVEKLPRQDVESSFQVKLISAVRVPAQHEKLIKAKCKNSKDMKLVLFEMDNNFAKDSGITMDEAIVKPSNENNITLVLRNNGFHPVCLEKGRVL